MKNPKLRKATLGPLATERRTAAARPTAGGRPFRAGPGRSSPPHPPTAPRAALTSEPPLVPLQGLLQGGLPARRPHRDAADRREGRAANFPAPPRGTSARAACPAPGGTATPAGSLPLLQRQPPTGAERSTPEQYHAPNYTARGQTAAATTVPGKRRFARSTLGDVVPTARSTGNGWRIRTASLFPFVVARSRLRACVLRTPSAYVPAPAVAEHSAGPSTAEGADLRSPPTASRCGSRRALTALLSEVGAGAAPGPRLGPLRLRGAVRPPPPPRALCELGRRLRSVVPALPVSRYVQGITLPRLPEEHGTERPAPPCGAAGSASARRHYHQKRVGPAARRASSEG